jgi:NTP pyrophosphatase (non-canonical NTP hydrolase)
MNGIRALIAAERKRQDARFGPHAGFDKDPPERNAAVLTEECGEVSKAVLEKDIENLKEELVQVAAVCWAWLETL